MNNKNKTTDQKSALSKYFAYVKKNRSDLIKNYGDPHSICHNIIDHPLLENIPECARFLFSESETDDLNYIIASTYALLIGDERRRELSAYFTPPALAKGVIKASAPFLRSKEHPSVLDPACGGGSFLTPITRYLVNKKRDNGIAVEEACRTTLRDIRGVELDPGLAALSQSLLKDMLQRTYAYTCGPKPEIVRCENALSASLSQRYDLVIGNPPYGKVGIGVDRTYLKNAKLANLGGHTNFYSLFLLKSLDWLKPSGGLVFVLPTSFVAGPYFSGLRQEIMSRADVLSIDLHEQRENLFLGAVQDVCVLTLQRRKSGASASNRQHPYKLGLIDATGARIVCGTGIARGDGEPWTLPVAQRAGRSAPHRKSPRKATNHEPCARFRRITSC
ncbi:HsdM family class I SAM-dependent methyltransferase [Oceanibacterium hippocampi]|nr:N-6 DNA methylase [Oceanibacterium hippocampi]